MRNMSFAMTTEQIRNGTKTVTRRFGWWFLKPGDLVRPVLKGMGLKKGEKVQPIRGPIRIVNAGAEPLSLISQDDVVREGFPEMTPSMFVMMLCEHYRKIGPETMVNRIEFEYTD